MNRGLSGWIPVISILFPVTCLVILRVLGSPRFLMPLVLMLPPTFVIAIVWTGLGCKSPLRSVVNGLMLWLGFVSILFVLGSISDPVEDYRPVGWNGIVSGIGVGTIMMAASLLVALFRGRPELVFFRDTEPDRMSLTDLFVALGLFGLALGGFRFAGIFDFTGTFPDRTTPGVLEMVVVGAIVALAVSLAAVLYVVWTSWISRASARSAWGNSVAVQCLLLTSGLTALAICEGLENAGEFTHVVVGAGLIFVIQATVFFVLLGMRGFGRNNVAHWRHVQGEWQRRYDVVTPAADNCGSVANDENRKDGCKFDEFNA